MVGHQFRPGQETDIEELDPEGIGQIRYLVPEIHWAVEQQDWFVHPSTSSQQWGLSSTGNQALKCGFTLNG